MKQSFGVVAFVIVLGIAASATSQWRPTMGPSGGGVRVLTVIDPYVFAAVGTSLYRSSDNGMTWTPAMSGLSNRTVQVLTSSGSTIYAGTDTNIFRSTDNGDSWTAMHVTLVAAAGDTEQDVTALATIGNRLVAGTAGGGGSGTIYLSTDGGATWKKTSTTNDEINTFNVRGSSLYAGARFSGVRLSTDSGATWTSAGLFENDVHSLAFIGSAIFADVSPGFYPQYIARSFDNGVTWSAPDSGSIDAGRVLALGTTLYMGTSTGVYRSSDSGASWVTANLGLANKGITTLAAKDGKLLAGNVYAGVFRSADSGKSWQASLSGMPAAVINHVAIDRSTMFASIPYAGLMRSVDRGATWSTVQAGLLANATIDALYVNGDNIFISAEGSIYRSQDEGSTWTAATNGLRFNQYHAIAALGSLLFAGGIGNDTNNVYRSTDNGNSWTVAAHGLPAAPNTYMQFDVHAMTAIGTSIFALVSDTVFRSIDSGANWSASFSDPLRGVARALVTNGSDLFVGTESAGVYRSSDHGTTWQNVSNGLASRLVTTAMYATHGVLFLAAKYGVYYSTNRGDTWISASDGLSSDYVTSFGSDGTDLFAGTNGSSVWRRSLSDFGIQNGVTARDAAPLAVRAYPNPSTSSIEISFTAETAGQANIIIVDQLGVEVGSVFSGEVSNVEQSVAWHRDPALPNGTYECVMSANGHVTVTPIVLM